MGNNASRRGAANLGVPLMIVAFIVIGGFMYWLKLQADEQQAMQVVEEEAPTEEVTVEGAVVVAPEELRIDASAYEGQIITLENLNVATALGTQGFWLEIPTGNPLLVALNDAQIAAGDALAAPGQNVTATGTILAMNDSILTAWTEAGTIGEGDRLAAEFATHFMQAEVVQIHDDGAGGAGDAGGEG